MFNKVKKFRCKMNPVCDTIKEYDRNTMTCTEPTNESENATLVCKSPEYIEKQHSPLQCEKFDPCNPKHVYPNEQNKTICTSPFFECKISLMKPTENICVCPSGFVEGIILKYQS